MFLLLINLFVLSMSRASTPFSLFDTEKAHRSNGRNGRMAALRNSLDVL